ncbi:MAG: hypothetical protein OEZ34_11440 [Spirochaetia bacterium]|nr:hypothetical protein [Spirochaetia bacterium]
MKVGTKTTFHGWKLCYREVTMKTLLKKEAKNELEKFGPDPILLRKKGLSDSYPRDISAYKKKIGDKDYLEHAINRIAMELSHFLIK